MADVHPLQTFRQKQSPEMSRAELADFLGVSRPTVHRWEVGDRKIDEELLPTISEKTGIPARELRPDLANLMDEATQ